MRILAASFEDLETATAVRDQLDRVLGLGEGTIRVAPMGQPRDPWTRTAVLAGRFREGAIDAVRMVVAEFDGTVVIDVDAGATYGHGS